MLKRAISCLLVPAILFQGLCNIPASAGPCAQEQVPHIHLGLFLSNHLDDGDEDENSDPADTHHEDDAVYVPVLEMLSKPVQGDVAPLSVLEPVAELPQIQLPVLVSSHFLTHSPPLPPCPIYLEMLILLI